MPYQECDIGPIIGTIEYVALKEHLFAYIFLMSNITMAIEDPYSSGNVLAPLWSIMIEVQFYIFIVPILIYLIKYKQKYIILFGILLIIFSNIYRLAVDDPHYIYSILLGRLDAFGFGVILGHMYLNLDFKKIENKYKYLSIYSIFGALCSFGISTYLGHPTKETTSVFVYFFSSLGGFFTIIAILTSINLFNFFSYKVFVSLGKISLGLYLFHTTGIYITQQYNFTLLSEPYSTGIVALFITVVISYLSYNYFEIYFLTLKKKFTKIDH